MANEVHLTIALPSQVFLETEVASVLLPAVRADVNILPERAPSVFTLDYGVLQILRTRRQSQRALFYQVRFGQHCRQQMYGFDFSNHTVRQHYTV
ncbi:MAG: hypothetical protein ACLU99_14380 [Alphaproteobacteria bacterium]